MKNIKQSPRKIKKTQINNVKSNLETFVKKTEDRLFSLENPKEPKSVVDSRKKITELARKDDVEFSTDKLNETNNALHTYFTELGETDSADLLSNITKIISLEPDNSITEDTANKILSVNNQINQNIKKISENMIDEQDTTIKNPNVAKTNDESANIIKDNEKPDNSSWFDNLFKNMLTGIFGGAFLSLFADAQYLKPYSFALKLFSLVSKDIANMLFKAGGAGLKLLSGLVKSEFLKVVDKLSDIGSSVFKEITKLLEPTINKVKSTIEYISNLVKPITKMIDNVKSLIGKTIDSIMTLPYAEKFVNLIPKDILKFSTKTVSNTTKVAEQSSKIASESLVKTVSKQTGKILSKKIPLGGGMVISAGLATSRALDGDYVGAGLEIASGLAAIVPVIGTAASLGIDGIIMYRDYNKDREKEKYSQLFQYEQSIAVDTAIKDTLKNDEILKGLNAQKIESLNKYKEFFKNGGASGSKEHSKLLQELTTNTASVETRKKDLEFEVSKSAKVEYAKMSFEKKAQNKSFTTDDFLETFRVSRGVNIGDLNKSVKINLLSLGSEYKDLTGNTMQINSGYRSISEQKSLNDKNPNVAASPGNSMHNYGMAVDLNSKELDEADKLGLLSKYGFNRPAVTKSGKPEKHHIQPEGISLSDVKNRNIETPNSPEKIESEIIKPEVYKDKREIAVDNSSKNLSQNAKMLSKPTVNVQQSSQGVGVNINTIEQENARLSSAFGKSELF